MNFFIKEIDEDDELDKISKFPKIIQRLIIKITEVIGIFFINNIDDNNKKIVIPNRKKVKVYKNINKYIKKEQDITKKRNYIILANRIKDYKKEFYNLKIINSRKYMLENLKEILQKILGNIRLEDLELHILVKNYNVENVSLIREIIQYVKIVNIITSDTGKYLNLEEILRENGIMINVSNNRRKGLKNANIIINIDFSKEDFNKYRINRNALILNTTSELFVDNLNGFDGIIVNDFEIELSNEIRKFLKENNIIKDFNIGEIYTALKYIKKVNNINISNNLNNKITILYGNNGEISKKELLNMQKNIDKSINLDYYNIAT